MKHEFTLEYWRDDGWYVGHLKEVPGVFSQGETLRGLEKNVREAYELMTGHAEIPTHGPTKSKPLSVDVR